MPTNEEHHTKVDPAEAKRLKDLVAVIRNTKSKVPSDFFTVCEALKTLTTDTAWRLVFPEQELDAFCKKHLGCSAGWARQQALIAERMTRRDVLKIGIARSKVVARMKEGSQRNRALNLAISGHSGAVITDKILGRDPSVRQYLHVLHKAWLLDKENRARLIQDLQAASRQEVVSNELKKKRVESALEDLAQ